MSDMTQLEQAQLAYKAGRLDDAAEHYKAALDADIENFPAASALGMLCAQKRDYGNAEIYLTHAAQLNPKAVQVHYALGVIFGAQARPGDALLAYERALALKPDFIEALNNRGAILRDTILHTEALECFNRALELDPNSAFARQNRDALLEGRTSNLTAISCFNLGYALEETKRFGAALAAYDRGLSIDPNLPYLRGARMYAKMLLCDWTDYEKDRNDIHARIAGGEPFLPFQIIPYTGDPALLQTAARNYVNDKQPAQPPLAQGMRYGNARIRLAYLSSDFNNHPVAHLLAGVIEKHDRSKFEALGISTGEDDKTIWRKRLEKSFDRFLDARQMNDADAANGIRDLEIDILIDLNGHTGGARTGILAHRPAPVQVNFLGYPGTLGADYADYILADRVVIPPEAGRFYNEEIVVLPHCFQPNGDRPALGGIPTRIACGLPEEEFVFCAFNSSFKITPDIFAVWMQLLREIPGSVLWLRDVPAARANLMREAADRNIPAERLVFAPAVQRIEDHLARQAQADLFLDTLHYNAHTTASDALWSGLPVLTCAGKSYASRVSASLLTALGLSELITHSLEEYQATAMALARDPGRLAAIKARLAQERQKNPLYDIARYTKNLEDAYFRMMAPR